MAKINLLKQFILNINNKKFSELPLTYQQVLFNIKENIKPNNFIKVIKYISGKKNILIINIDNEKYYVTILTKNEEIIYDDTIYHFINILRKFKFSTSQINNLLYFHWGDTTLNNSGKIRYSSKDLYEHNHKLFVDINNSFNKQTILLNLLEQLLFVDEIYQKPISNIIILNKDKMISFKKVFFLNLLVNNKYYKFSDVHIGPFSFQNKRRNLAFNKHFEYRRLNVLIKWFDIYKFLNNTLAFENK